MHYLGLAISGEGPTDHRFLGPVLRRATESLCLAQARSPIDIGPVLEFPDFSHGREPGAYLDRIVSTARDAVGAFSLIFVHRDGANDPDGIRAMAIAPIVARLVRDAGITQERIVAVVPVRETEAWALADGDALRKVFGTRLSDTELGLAHHGRDIEGINDPKHALEDAYRKVIGTRRPLRPGVAAYFEALGEAVSIRALQRLDAFRRMERDLRTALTNLGVFR